ncbi:MAG: STAS domain-containing protein [Sciscionella sp.]
MISFNTVREGDVLVLEVTGEVDLDHAEELREAVLATFDEQPAEVWIDLAGVSFLNSSGLGALLSGVKEAESRGIRFAVRRQQPQVRKVVDMVGLTEVLGTEGESGDAGG